MHELINYFAQNAPKKISTSELIYRRVSDQSEAVQSNAIALAVKLTVIIQLSWVHALYT